jgi:hypothetical protein
MSTLHQYNQARAVIEDCFKGLSHAPRVLVHTLITKADLSTGLVENINYRDLAACLTVFAAPGRKDSGTPSKQAVRNYLNTIQTQCGDHFQLSSEGQSLKITFPTLPKIYKSCVESFEVNTVSDRVQNTEKPLVRIDSEAFFEDLFNREEPIEVHTEVNTPDPIETINACVYASAKIKTKNLTNNKQTTESESFADLKKPIARDFYPSPETIELALEKGFVKVTSDIEIKRFVMYNEASLSRWADYNPVFLNWLENDHNPDAEYAPATPKQRNLRKNNVHAKRSTHQDVGLQPSVADSIRKNMQTIADEEREQQASDYIEGDYFEIVDIAHVTL